MEILESWQNERDENFAIVREPAGSYVAMWEDNGELYDFGGSPDVKLARFKTLTEARTFLADGLANEGFFVGVLEVKPGEELPF
jgi:hypothetical protein